MKVKASDVVSQLQIEHEGTVPAPSQVLYVFGESWPEV